MHASSTFDDTPNRRAALRAAAAVAALLAALLTLTTTPSAVAHEPPALAYRTARGVVTSTASGTVLAQFEPSGFYKLGGDLYLGARMSTTADGRRPGPIGAVELAGFDAVTGAERFILKHAWDAAIVDGGRQVAFIPTDDLDPQMNSLWLRDEAGNQRRVVQFSSGGRAPGVDTGIAGASIMRASFDRTASTVAVTMGMDGGDGGGIFRYDVWAVDVASGKARRLTTGERSNYGDVSPGGATVALVREEGLCYGEGIGVRAGDLQVVASSGKGLRTVFDGDCDQLLTTPKWVSDTELVAYRLTRTGEDRYRVDLVVVDTVTGEVRTLVDTGDVASFDTAVDPARVLYTRAGRRSAMLVDPATGATTTLQNVLAPALAGGGRIEP